MRPTPGSTLDDRKRQRRKRSGEHGAPDQVRARPPARGAALDELASCRDNRCYAYRQVDQKDEPPAAQRDERAAEGWTETSGGGRACSPHADGMRTPLGRKRGDHERE